jgi:PhzF family phenazine biosynthesis protein
VVLDGTGLSSQEMHSFARWTNLSETTFVLPPSAPDADYRVRIFTPVSELPFAGHPTLGSCHAWLATAGSSKQGDVVIQECAAGLVAVRQTRDGLAFAAPSPIRSGPVERPVVEHVASMLQIEPAEILDAHCAELGPVWLAVLLASADAVLALRPRAVDRHVGVVGPHPAGTPEAFEVRAFFPMGGSTGEDPVTGSLNAAIAQWLLGSGRASTPYVASQGTALGRAGRVHISSDPDGTIWVGGGTVSCIEGQVAL